MSSRERASRAREPRPRRGSNQVGLGQYNERIVLHSIRTRGAVPKAELARLTGLSNQTMSLIIDRLLDAGLVRKRDPVRGRIGQPSVPIALNPDGAFALGVKIGRRNLDVLLVDFCGAVRGRSTVEYDFPDPDRLFEDLRRRIGSVRRRLPAALRSRVVGTGVAAPLTIGGWQDMLGIAPHLAARWNGVDIARKVRAVTRLPVEFAKDTTAACVAELVSGCGQRIDSFLYLFVDTFIGGGLVLDGQLYAGRHGNAGAVASMPLGLAEPAAAPPQLLSSASLWTLERLYAGAGLDPSAAGDARALAAPWLDHTIAWKLQAGNAIAAAVTSAAALLDVDAVVIDGACDPELLRQLIAATQESLAHYRWEGLQHLEVLPGSHGGDARALGGALLPFHARFSPDPDVFIVPISPNVAAMA